jgi:predicted ATPase
LGETALYLGEFVAAREHLEHAIALYDPRSHQSYQYQSTAGHDQGVMSLGSISTVLFALGYLDQALQRSQEAVTLARELPYPVSLAFALFCAALCHHVRGEVRAVRERAEALLALATEHEFPDFLGMGTVLRAMALSEEGKPQEASAQMRPVLAAWRESGMQLGFPFYAVRLAEVYARAGQPEEGLDLVAEAEEVSDRTHQHGPRSSLYGIKGELLLGVSEQNQVEAEACFRRAIDLSRGKSAKLDELLATTRLSRLWQKQGKNAEARQILAEIYGWFTEGLDTRPLKEAKALLEELG